VNSPIQIDPLSMMSCRIELKCNGNILGPATGALWTRNNKTYLISNWHVFSGRNTYSGQPIFGNGRAVPDIISVRVAMETFSGIEWFVIELPLGDEFNSTWLQHPTKGQTIDVAALEIPNNYLGYKYLALGDTFPSTDIKIEVGEEVSIIGYPLGLQKQFGFPIWKRATIASEYLVPVDELPIFMVDSTTREGMSGSPVIAKRVGSYIGSKGGMVVQGVAYKFLGVYSGRYGATKDENEVQLGRVWHSELVNQIIDGSTHCTVKINNIG
jgi:hypothetical protein